jgi:hypothetical protein
MTYTKVGQSIFPHDHYALWPECPTGVIFGGSEWGERQKREHQEECHRPACQHTTRNVVSNGVLSATSQT